MSTFDYFSFTITVKVLISYYTLFISITYTFIKIYFIVKYILSLENIYNLYFRLYFRLCICLNKLLTNISIVL